MLMKEPFSKQIHTLYINIFKDLIGKIKDSFIFMYELLMFC